MASSSPLTERSQGEAKGETKDFSGCQKAKGFQGYINFYSRKDLTELKECMHKCRKFVLENFTISVKNVLASSWLPQKEAMGKPKVKQRISMEAKKPRVLEETLIFVRKKILLKQEKTHLQMKKIRSSKLHDFSQECLGFKLASDKRKPWGSQGEAKGETKDFNGNQEAKGFEGNINFYSKIDLTETKIKCIHKCRKFVLENFRISVKNALASSWLLTKRSQGEAKGETKDFSGSQEAQGFERSINFYSKKRSY